MQISSLAVGPLYFLLLAASELVTGDGVCASHGKQSEACCDGWQNAVMGVTEY